MKHEPTRGESQWRTASPLDYCRQPAKVGVGEPTPPINVPRNRILVGDALTRLRQLPSDSIDCITTSPPYAGLRRYTSDAREIGQESSVDEWVDHLRAVGRELSRVMKPAATLALNVGDSFSTGSKWGAPRKSMLASAERLLLALMEDGLILRSRIIWHKPNSRPTSAVDRLSLNYEYVYILAKQPMYYWNLKDIREPHKTAAKPSSVSIQLPTRPPEWAGALAAGSQAGLIKARLEGRPGHPDGKNPGSVFTIAPKGYPGHPAAWPPELVKRLLLVGCPRVVCTRCGTPSPTTNAACGCHGDLMPGVVLDPFLGSGTTAVVAEQLGRNWLGIDLSPKYARLARRRITEARRGS